MPRPEISESTYLPERGVRSMLNRIVMASRDRGIAKTAIVTSLAFRRTLGASAARWGKRSARLSAFLAMNCLPSAMGRKVIIIRPTVWVIPSALDVYRTPHVNLATKLVDPLWNIP